MSNYEHALKNEKVGILGKNPEDIKKKQIEIWEVKNNWKKQTKSMGFCFLFKSCYSVLSLPGCCLVAEAVARPLSYTQPLQMPHYRQPRTVVRSTLTVPVLATVQGQGYEVHDFPMMLGGSGAGVVRSLSCKAITDHLWQWTAGLPISFGRCPWVFLGGQLLLHSDWDV